MRDQEILGLQEAYLQVHEPQELTEEVQIAAQYFYEMGLNEEGVEILIEELGVEEFAEWVQDLSDEYYLEEARRSGAIEPKTAKGQEIKGKPSAASLKRLRRLKAERGESEERASEQKPSGLTASLRRQSAVANAKKQQPKKKGVLDRVAGAVLSGIERHNKAMGELEKMKAATAETAGKVKKAAGEFARGFRGEEFDLFDAILEHLVAEGYADTNENALVIMANMSEEWRQSIIEAGEHIGSEPKTVGGRERPGVKGETYEERRKRMKPGVKKESFDLFDTILEYLVAEGYADTNENALVIMANMSEEWRQSIVEGKREIPNVNIRQQMKRKLRSDKMKDWEDVGRMAGHTGVPVPKH